MRCPFYGNIIRLSNHLNNINVLPAFLKKDIVIDSSLNRNLFPAAVRRDFFQNHFTVTAGRADDHYTETPFHINDSIILQLVNDTLHKSILKEEAASNMENLKVMEIHSRPTDSMLKPLMYQSDNFFCGADLAYDKPKSYWAQ